MKKTLLSLLICAALTLSGCGARQDSADSAALQVAATSYPVYLLTQAVTEGIDGVEVKLVIDQQVSCLHNYTLTMQDMEAVEKADVLVENGAGLEDFLDDVLDGRDVIDASTGISLLDGDAHNDADDDGHDHAELEHDHVHEEDPHIWMDPRNAAVMVQNIAAGLAEADPERADEYRANARTAADELTSFHQEMLDKLGGSHYDLITFHDGFAYFADSFGMHLLAAVEEEEGSEASAKTIKAIVALVEENDIPAVFTETNGSDATAQVICRECGIQTYPLSMCMSGDGGGLAAYEAVIRGNIETIMEAYQ